MARNSTAWSLGCGCSTCPTGEWHVCVRVCVCVCVRVRACVRAVGILEWGEGVKLDWGLGSRGGRGFRPWSVPACAGCCLVCVVTAARDGAGLRMASLAAKSGTVEQSGFLGSVWMAHACLFTRIVPPPAKRSFTMTCPLQAYVGRAAAVPGECGPGGAAAGGGRVLGRHTRPSRAEPLDIRL